jgi:hypothetical protein
MRLSYATIALLFLAVAVWAQQPAAQQASALQPAQSAQPIQTSSPQCLIVTSSEGHRFRNSMIAVY